MRIAGEAGLNAAAMPGCLYDPKTKEQLRGRSTRQPPVEVKATPTLYINGKKLPRINDFVPVIEKEARRRAFRPSTPRRRTPVETRPAARDLTRPATTASLTFAS